MTELSFLIELLLNHDLPKATKDLVAERIREVESRLVPAPMPHPMARPQATGSQCASTQALMAKHGDISVHFQADLTPSTEPVTVVAQTPATMAAMQSRQQAIAESMAGKIDKLSGRPRKF